MATLGEVQALVQKVCAPLALAINILLIYLILRHSPKSLGFYKYLMIYIALFEMIYAIVDIISAPDLYCFDSMFLVITFYENSSLPRWIYKVINVVFCTFFAVSMAIFALHFIYRYLAVSGSSYVKSYSFGKSFVWFFSPILYGIFYATAIEFTLSENEKTNMVLRKTYLSNRTLKVENLIYIGQNYWFTDEKGNVAINLMSWFGIAVPIFTVILSSSTMLIFGTLSYRAVASFAKNTSNSKQYHSMQLQLLNALVLQALIPVFLMQLPSFIAFTSPIFHKGNEMAGAVLGIAVALYPVLDPLPTLIIIKNFRNALFKPCTRKKIYAVQQETPIATTSQSVKIVKSI
ncbi:Serpentine receptor class r-10 [Caenorhabditis elegans]|uniref:Serpentine receptor class r-10 n=1 Tax=Caenorhabditis elegans TaxID=6239 RepID=O61981_CAEEL|nr:Seven TM Receptor [Caenorhabditis elegans]CCD67031.1 Seven TM Receptor [Caenorhabditis elegans]|eukprot:NP_503436.1 Seven TM Receptor [Caenorhabditis elegans]